MLPGPDRYPAAEMASPPLEGQMVALQSGLDVAAEPLYLSGYRDLRNWLDDPFQTPPLLPESQQLVVDPNFWTQKEAFLRWRAALKNKESQCPKPERTTRPA